MPEAPAIPATQKAQLQWFLEHTGSQDFAGAQEAVTNWRAYGDQVENFRGQEQALFQIFGVDNHNDLINAINDMTVVNANQNGTLQNIFKILGVTDQNAAINTIQQFKADHDQADNFKTILGDLRKTLNLPENAAPEQILQAVSDYEGRVDTEVINRAASAGITAPIKKPPGGEVGAKIMTREQFANLTPGERMRFIQGGGHLTDET